MKEGNGVFIGARALNETQVKLIVPTYENVINQVQEIRGEAEKNYKNRESYEKKQHNNTIGLFGERGSGKTSTMFTILKKLECDGNWDIVLPIIEPDTYGDSTKILGAILGVLKEYMNKLEKSIKENKDNIKKLPGFFKDCRFKENNELEKSYNNMLEYYCYKDPEYRKLLIKSYSDMETYKNKYSYLLAPDYNFNEKLKSFIENMVNVKRELNNGKEPLIIITIDDIDLKTNKCKELIDSVIQYTCHPNIVCFLSGDYEMLSESITLALLESEELAKTSLVNNKDIFDSGYNLITRKKYLAHEYLKKVLPPAFRHSVVKWDLNTIPNFSFENYGELKKKYLYEKLDELFENESIFKITESNNNKEIFLPKAPYCIFDRTPRGLINVFYHLSKVNSCILNDSEKRFAYIKSLVDTIVASSSYLIENQSNFYKKNLIWGGNEKNTVLNFERLHTKKLKESLEKKEESDNSKKNNKSSYNTDNNEKDKKKFVERYIVFFTLLKVVKELLPNAIHTGYDESEKYYFYLYNFNMSENILDINYKSEIIDNEAFKKERQKLNKFKDVTKGCIEEMLFNTNYIFALEYLEKMKKNTNIEELYEVKLNKDQENEMFMILSSLIRGQHSEELIKNWILQIDNYRHTIAFLDLFSRESSNNEYIEKLLENYKFKGENKINILYTNVERWLLQNPENVRLNNVDSNVIYEKYKKQLFYNYIIKEKYKCSLEYNKDSNDSNTLKTYKLLKILNVNEKVVSKDENKIHKVMLNGFHKSTNRIINNCEEIDISSSKLRVKFEEHFEKIYSSETVESRTNKFMRSILKVNNEYKSVITMESYIKIYEKLYYLGYMSNAWYGVIEARNLIELLQKEAYIKINDNLYNTLMNQYVKYAKNNYFLTEEFINQESIKKEMRDLLEKAFNKAKDNEEKFYSDFNLELEDNEENDSDVNKNVLSGEY